MRRGHRIAVVGLLSVIACARAPRGTNAHPGPISSAPADTDHPAAAAAGGTSGDATPLHSPAPELSAAPANCITVSASAPRVEPPLPNFPTSAGRVFRWAWVQLGCRWAPAPLDQPVELNRTHFGAWIGPSSSVSWKATFGAGSALRFHGYLDDTVKGAGPSGSHGDYPHRLLRALLPFVTGYLWLAPETLGLSGAAPLLVFHDARGVPLLAFEDMGTFDRASASITEPAPDWPIANIDAAIFREPLPAHTRVERYFWNGWAEPPAATEVWGLADYVDTYSVGGTTFTIPRTQRTPEEVPSELLRALTALDLPAAESLRLAYVLLLVGALHQTGDCLAGARIHPTLRLRPEGARCLW